MKKFNVTYQIWNDEDLEIGDTDKKGFDWADCNLIDVIYCIKQVSNLYTDNRECHLSDDCIHVDFGSHLETGDRLEKDIHFPKNITASSKKRIFNLIDNLY